MGQALLIPILKDVERTRKTGTPTFIDTTKQCYFVGLCVNFRQYERNHPNDYPYFLNL